MLVNFVGQPFADEDNLHDFLSETLGAREVESLDVVVAWAKRSGLARVAQDLLGFRDRGGSARIIVGIDEGGATRQGLELAIDLFDEAFIFHDRARRTFHPKIYVASGHGQARVFLGSNNLTAGGVFFNYESAVDIQLELDIEQDDQFLRSVGGYIERLLEEADLCRRLDRELLNTLAQDSRFRIGDEDAQRSQRRLPDEPEDSDQLGGDEQEELPSPFGAGRAAKRPDPRPVTGRRADAGRVPRGPAGPADTTPATVTRPAGGTGPGQSSVVRRWTKQLARSDAYQPAPGSHPTANLRLTKAGHDIDWRTWFREDLFLTANWAPDTDPSGHAKEVAWVPFQVVFDGQDLGEHELLVDHAPHRESGQSNHVTVLRWGALTGALAQQDFVGYFVSLERLADGTFRLEITPTDPGAIL